MSEDLAKKKHALRRSIEAWSHGTGQPIVARAPEMSPIRLVNCKLVSNRIEGIKLLPRGARCVEVGTQTGAFARQILDIAAPSELHLIDLVWSTFDRSIFSQAELSGTLHLHEGYSDAMLTALPDNYFDWIYIDASHAYENVSKDIAISATKLRSTGFIVCNDYTTWSPGEVENYGVMYALNEFCEREDWEFVYFALQGEGFHDVCVRKRQ